MHCGKCQAALEMVDNYPIFTGYTGTKTRSVHYYCSNCDTEFVSVGNEPLRILDEA